MRKVINYVLFGVIGIFLAGCGTASKEIMMKAHSKRVNIFSEVKDENTPPLGSVVMLIRASIKTHLVGHYILESEESLHGKPGYPFVVNIDGQGIIWKAAGQEETAPVYDEKGERNPEGGTGMRYTIEKKIRLAAGSHLIFFGLPEDRYSVRFQVTLKEGDLHVLELKPVYRKNPRYRRRFEHGVSTYKIFLNGNSIPSRR
jgi:hypothetical protein